MVFSALPSNFATRSFCAVAKIHTQRNYYIIFIYFDENLIMKSWMISLILFLSFTSIAALAAPKALVYKGPGACDDGCWQASYDLAKYAGFDAVYVGPNALTSSSTQADRDAIFKDAAVWIQPGGYAGVAMQNMTSQLKNALKEFIAAGGGYIGFCAGAFVATAKVGTTSIKGLGIFPGGTKLYGKGVDLKKIDWLGQSRFLYWEGGPYLRNLPGSVEVTATYPNGAPVSARTSYGKGRVYVSGVHPEAPQEWLDYTGETDTDGLDYDLGVAMLRWVTFQ